MLWNTTKFNAHFLNVNLNSDAEKSNVCSSHIRTIFHESEYSSSDDDDSMSISSSNDDSNSNTISDDLLNFSTSESSESFSLLSDNYDVELIVDAKFEGDEELFLIKWTGYNDFEWVKRKNMNNCDELINQYYIDLLING